MAVSKYLKHFILRTASKQVIQEDQLRSHRQGLGPNDPRLFSLEGVYGCKVQRL